MDDSRAASERFARSLREGFGGKPEAALLAQLGVPADADDRQLVRALLSGLTALDDRRLVRRYPTPLSAAEGRASFVPVVTGADRSFLARLKVRSEEAGEQSVAAMTDVPTLLAVLRAGSLAQRRASARRIAERLGDHTLSADDRYRIQQVVEQLRDVELLYDLLACHAMLSGPASREAEEMRREVHALAAQIQPAIYRYWEGDAQDEPLMMLSGDARAQLMLHARDLSDPILWHVSALIEGAHGGADLAQARALLSSVRYASDPRLVPSLVAVLADEESLLVVEAARAISRIDDARVFPALVAAYERSVIDVERIALGAALGRLGDVRAADYIRAQLSSDDEHVFIRALEGLRTVGTPDDVPAVLALLRARDRVVASKAAHTLGRISDGRGLAELARIAREAEVSSLRAAAEESVAQIGARLVLRGEEPTGELTQLSADPDAPAPVTARVSLGVRTRALRLYLAGRAWQLLGATSRALTRFEAAVICWPDWAMPMIVAGMLYAARDDYAQALSLFRRALALSRTRIEKNPLIIRHVARCFLRRSEQVERDGRRAIARGLLDEVLSLDLRRVPSSLRFEIGRRHETLRAMGTG